MAIMKRARDLNLKQEARKIFGDGKTILAIATLVLLVLAMMCIGTPGEVYLSSSSPSKVSSNVDFHVDETCTKLPSIRQSGSYFLDSKINGGVSYESITPSFKVGSYYADKVKYHMKGDTQNFELIKEVVKGNEGGLTVDFGANQGFYSYYMAALGMEVHSFEINEANFRALQHGAEFNPKDIADRVHLYPVGMGEKNARFGMQGNNYEGFLKEGQSGPILGATFDCFAHHMREKLDFSNVAFVKLDVEGFEIAVLRGAKNSLFKQGTNIGGMIVEVGPARWKRSSHDFTTGLDEMKKLATHFKNSYILVRGGGGYEKTCPKTLADDLADKNPRQFESQNMYKVKMNEWSDLMKKMEKSDFDCNFFYRN